MRIEKEQDKSGENNCQVMLSLKVSTSLWKTSQKNESWRTKAIEIAQTVVHRKKRNNLWKTHRERNI